MAIRQCMRGGHANVTITSISYHITHAYTRACICTYTPTRTHACTYVHKPADIHTWTRTYVSTRAYVHPSACTPRPGSTPQPSLRSPLPLPGRGLHVAGVGACGKIAKGRASTAWRVRSLLPLLLPLLLLQSITTTSTTFAPAPPHSPLPPRSLTLHCPQAPHSPLPLTPRSLALISLMLSPMLPTIFPSPLPSHPSLPSGLLLAGRLQRPLPPTGAEAVGARKPQPAAALPARSTGRQAEPYPAIQSLARV